MIRTGEDAEVAVEGIKEGTEEVEVVKGVADRDTEGEVDLRTEMTVDSRSGVGIATGEVEEVEEEEVGSNLGLLGRTGTQGEEVEGMIAVVEENRAGIREPRPPPLTAGVPPCPRLRLPHHRSRRPTFRPARSTWPRWLSGSRQNRSQPPLCRRPSWVDTRGAKVPLRVKVSNTRERSDAIEKAPDVRGNYSESVTVQRRVANRRYQLRNLGPRRPNHLGNN
jgi:hypothetical protein